MGRTGIDGPVVSEQVGEPLTPVVLPARPGKGQKAVEVVRREVGRRADAGESASEGVAK